MKIDRRFLPIGIFIGFSIAIFSGPTSLVIAFETTSFQVGDTYSFEMNNFDIKVTLNDTSKIDSSNYTFISIKEPMDVTITDVEVIDPITSESNILTSIDFLNPNINDSNGLFYINTLTWDEYIQFGSLLSILLVGNFDPYNTDFTDTIVTQDMFFADPSSLAINGSILFPSMGGEMMPFFVDVNENHVSDLYDQYLDHWNDLNATGSPQEGHAEYTSTEYPVGLDQINVTQWLFEYIKWDNQTKLFDLSYGLEILHFGTYNNGVQFNSHSNFSVQIKIDFTKGIVSYYDQELEIEYNVPEASYFFLYNVGFNEFNRISEVTDTHNSRSVIVSTPSNVISKSTRATITDTNIEETSADPTVNFSTVTIFLGLIVIQVYYRKR